MTEVRFVRCLASDYLYGDALFCEKRSALVVRTEASSWTVFRYWDCRLWCDGVNRPDTSKAEAMKEAASYLQSGIVLQICEMSPRLLDKQDELMLKYSRFDAYKVTSILSRVGWSNDDD